MKTLVQFTYFTSDYSIQVHEAITCPNFRVNVLHGYSELLKHEHDFSSDPGRDLLLKGMIWSMPPWGGIHWVWIQGNCWGAWGSIHQMCFPTWTGTKVLKGMKTTEDPCLLINESCSLPTNLESTHKHIQRTWLSTAGTVYSYN